MKELAAMLCGRLCQDSGLFAGVVNGLPELDCADELSCAPASSDVEGVAVSLSRALLLADSRVSCSEESASPMRFPELGVLAGVATFGL